MLNRPDNSDLPLENIPEHGGEVPETRIKNASVGRQLFVAMQESDRARSLNRARHQALLDGEPPFDHAVLVKNGAGSTTNVNWGDAKASVEGVMAGAIDMDASVEKLLRIPIRKVVVPDDDLRFNWENILAEEHTRAVRGWEDYNRNYLNLAFHCFVHGVGIAYFENEWDWRYETTGLGDFVVPAGTKASENRIVLAGCLRYMEVHELYSYIRDEEAAARMGWNVEAVRAALLNAMPEHRGEGYTVNGWMKFQQDMRNNDMGRGMVGTTSKVGVIHEWVQEFSGKVSKFICAQNPLDKNNADNEPWLYQRKDIYNEMRSGLVLFTYGIGDNGTIHSISGILRAIFPQANALNRAQCRMLDAATIGAGLLMQPDSESSISRMNLVIGPGVTTLPPADRGQLVIRPMPDVAGGLMPIVSDLRRTMGQRAGQFQGESGFDGGGPEKTRFQVAAELESLGKVGATQTNLWYPPRTRLLREQLRRMCRDNYSAATPGGREIVEFRRRLEERGFPLELLAAIDFDGVVAERAIGAGSGAARTGTLSLLNEMAGDFDSIGQYNLRRDRAAAACGGDYGIADRYIPARPATRPTQDTKNANLENALMKLGEEVVLEVNDIHIDHLDSHVPFLMKMVEMVNNGEATMRELVEPMAICHEHATLHLESIQLSPMTAERAAEYRQVMQQLGEVVGNAIKQAVADEREAALAGQAEGQEGNGEGDQKLQERVMLANIKLDAMQTQQALKEEFKQRDHQMALQHGDEKFRAEMARSDAKAAADLLVNAKKQLSQVDATAAKANQAMQLDKLRQTAKLNTPAKKKPKSK